MAEVQVRYFAGARDLCGTPSERVALPSSVTTVEALLLLLGARHARLAPLISRMRIAVNGELARNEDAIAPEDEISVLPPLAGGSGVLLALRTEPLSVDEAIAAVRWPGAGGIALFIGVVRDHADGKAVARLDYEAHPELAPRELTRIHAEVSARWPDVRVAALHRVGELLVGELAVVVAASAPHREQAFAACREMIELIKQRVPIWKHEWSKDGSGTWVNLEP
jgi:molybdopterin converting factor subunit 1